MKKNKSCVIHYVKNNIKNFYFQEKYRYYIKGRKKAFDKQYILLSNVLARNECFCICIYILIYFH